MAERLLLLLSTTTYKASAFLAAAEQLGVEVVVGTDRRQALAGLNPQGNLTFDFVRPERAVPSVLEHHRTYPITAVVAADDEGLPAAAAISEALELRANAPAAVAAALSKRKTREALARAGLATPWFRPCRLDEDLAALGSELRYPLVVKPLSLSASRGVIRADDPAGFVAACRRLAAILGYAEGDTPGPEVLVEGFIPGLEVAVEGLLTGGELRVLAIFDKPDPLDGPFFEETIYVTPSRHSDDLQRAIVRSLRQAVAALGLTEGPIHAELRVGDAGATVLEVAPRSIGGLCARALRFTPPAAGADVSLEELIVRHALGCDVSGYQRERRASGVMMIPVPRAGILRSVEGMESAAGVTGVEAVRITSTRGQPVAPAPEGSRYLGFIFARAAGPGAVETALRSAHGRLRVDVERSPTEPRNPRR